MTLKERKIRTLRRLPWEQVDTNVRAEILQKWYGSVFGQSSLSRVLVTKKSKSIHSLEVWGFTCSFCSIFPFDLECPNYRLSYQTKFYKLAYQLLIDKLSNQSTCHTILPTKSWQKNPITNLPHSDKLNKRIESQPSQQPYWHKIPCE